MRCESASPARGPGRTGWPVRASHRGSAPGRARSPGRVRCAPDHAVWIELIVEVPAQYVSGTLYADDLRVRDRNLLRNGDFEQDVPTGPYMGDYNPPEWTVRGTELVDDPARAHDGQRALALVPAGPSHLIEQRIAPAVGTGYRVSAWIRTEGVTLPPRIS